MPIILKGIGCAEDAVLAYEAGVQGIVLSNHGGRQLDGAVASADALAAVVDAVVCGEGQSGVGLLLYPNPKLPHAEIAAAFADLVRAPDPDDGRWVAVSAQRVLQSLFCRASSRAFVGLALCKYLRLLAAPRAAR